MRQTARGERRAGRMLREIRSDKSWRSFAIWLRAILWNINHTTALQSVLTCAPVLQSRLVLSQWSESIYLFDGIHFSLNRERGRNYFFDSGETKTFSAERAKRDKNLILRRVNEANTSTNEFQLFQIKVDVTEVKMTLASRARKRGMIGHRVAANNKCIGSRAKEVFFIFHFFQVRRKKTSNGMGKELVVIFLHLKMGFHRRNSFLCKITDWTQSFFVVCLKWSLRGNS